MTLTFARRLLAPALAALALAGCALTPGRATQLIGAPGAVPKTVETRTGPVRGVVASAGQVFLGIPFAAPPIGTLRFQPPRPVQPWTAVRDATRAGAECVQAPLPGGQAVSEDCLNLNVYAPHDADAAHPRPVMVWLYGGGFVIGNNVQNDPSAMAERQGVVIVAPNYRLGVLGFLAHPALKGEGEGSYALLDQQAALRWVRDNIAGFGGDPGNVTLFGESAGGWSVCYQLTAPGARGLFHKAIIESGACTSPDSAISMQAAEAGGVRMAGELGCTDPSTAAVCLRALPVSVLRKAKPRRRGLLGIESWSPAYGGDVLPESPLAALRAGRFARVPVIDGTNHDEGRLFLGALRLQGKLYSQASFEKIIGDFFDEKTPTVLAEYAAETARDRRVAYANIVTDATFACPAWQLNALLRPSVPVYAYEFDDPQALFALPRTPFVPPLGAYHSSEIAYVFATRWSLADPARFSPAQRVLSDRMQAAWASLARSGSPSLAARADWPRDTGAGPVRLAPDGPATAGDFAVRHHCAFWETLR